MEKPTALPAPSTPAVLPARPPMQIPSAVTSPTPPAAPAPSVHAAPPASTASPTPPRTVPPVRPASPAQTPAPPTKPVVPVRPAALAPHTQAAPTTKKEPAVEITKASANRGDEHAEEPDGSEEEAVVKRHITSLWADHEKKMTSLTKTKASIHTTKEQLNLMRAELGKHFFELKSLLAKPGRKGGWAEFLRDEGIPRASADRYAKSHKRLLEGDHGKRLTEAISIPTEAEIKKMVVKLTPRLVQALPTPESITQFIREMTAALQPSGLAA
jgi:hypothetical protein